MRRLIIILSLVAVTPIAAQQRPPSESVLSRFLRYVRIDTQSAEDQGRVPSTPKQFALSRLLAKELESLGAAEVRVDEHAIVYAKVPGNLPSGHEAPVLGFLSHLDTAPNVSGTAVTPVVHAGYRGGDITLPGDPTQIIRAADNPDLGSLVGDDIVTADGTTLLGSDDKAGVAEIMTLVDLLAHNPEIQHGTLAIGFLPDEEVGGAVAVFDLKGFGARFAYTVDGGGLGGINDETFSARSAYLTFKGRDGAPVKGRLVNSVYAAADFIGRIPPSIRAENVEGREGYLHPYVGNLTVGESTLKLRMRDFTRKGLDDQEALLRSLMAETQARFPAVAIGFDVKDLFFNMKDSLTRYPKLIEHAMAATRRAGLEPRLSPIRGGTDGSNLTNRGLPTPDLFTGGHNFHTRLEWNSRRGLEKTVEMLVRLVGLFAIDPPRPS